MKILFRADSSSYIGTGHIMRDLVLASQYETSNIMFATQNLEGNINAKIIEAKYNLKILESNNSDELDSLIKKLQIDLLVIDHYEIDDIFEKKLKMKNPNVKILSFDDTYKKHCCDILLNHNIYADSKKYKNLVPPKCKLKCGSKYTLLRDEFILEKKIGRQNKSDIDNLNVFIGMGGADHSNINIKILDVLKGFSNIHAHVVTTIANKHLQELKNYVACIKNITLHINTNKIARLMNKADFAIITPSVTINEIIYLNVPFIAIQTADNQKYMYDYLVIHKYKVVQKFNSKAISCYVDQIIKELI